MLSEPLLVVARLARAFDDLAIRYVVGGSLASSLHGIPRATQDVDLVAEIELSHKLVLYRLGHEVSDRQWGDVLGVLKVQSGSLDREYLELWARLLNVFDLLSRAEQQPE
jgi:hypothetical protein